MHPVPGRRIFGCFGSNLALTGVSGALSGVLSVPAQSALISAETPFDFVGSGALHIVGNMGIYITFQGAVTHSALHIFR